MDPVITEARRFYDTLKAPKYGTSFRDVNNSLRLAAEGIHYKNTVCISYRPSLPAGYEVAPSPTASARPTGPAAARSPSRAPSASARFSRASRASTASASPTSSRCNALGRATPWAHEAHGRRRSR